MWRIHGQARRDKGRIGRDKCEHPILRLPR
jgi:hypothetical protein